MAASVLYENNDIEARKPANMESFYETFDDILSVRNGSLPNYTALDQTNGTWRIKLVDSNSKPKSKVISVVQWCVIVMLIVAVAALTYLYVDKKLEKERLNCTNKAKEAVPLNAALRIGKARLSASNYQATNACGNRVDPSTGNLWVTSLQASSQSQPNIRIFNGKDLSLNSTITEPAFKKVLNVLFTEARIALTDYASLNVFFLDKDSLKIINNDTLSFKSGPFALCMIGTEYQAITLRHGDTVIVNVSEGSVAATIGKTHQPYAYNGIVYHAEENELIISDPKGNNVKVFKLELEKDTISVQQVQQFIVNWPIAIVLCEITGQLIISSFTDQKLYVATRSQLGNWEVDHLLDLQYTGWSISLDQRDKLRPFLFLTNGGHVIEKYQLHFKKNN